MPPFTIIKIEIVANSRQERRYVLVSLDVNIFVLERPPEAFDKDIVKDPSTAIHTDQDAGSLQPPGKFAAGELRALITVENLWSLNPQRVFERDQTKVDFQGVGDLPAQDISAVPVDDRHQYRQNLPAGECK